MCLATQEVVAGDLESAREQATTALSLARADREHQDRRGDPELCWGQSRSIRTMSPARSGSNWTLSPRRGRPRIPGPPDRPHQLVQRHREHRRVRPLDGLPPRSAPDGRETGDHLVALHGIEAVGELHLRLGAPRTAARLLAAADRYRIDYAQPLDDHERGLKDQIIEETRAAVGEVGFAVAWSEGATCTLEEAISEAFASSRLIAQRFRHRMTGGRRQPSHGRWRRWAASALLVASLARGLQIRMTSTQSPRGLWRENPVQQPSERLNRKVPPAH